MLGWVDKLSAHFGAVQDEEQVKIFLHALRNSTPYQVDVAFDRCLNECQFMPKLADIHQRMPQEKWAPENPAAFVKNGPDTLELVRAVARELFPNLDSLSGKELQQAFFVANRVRYERMGIDCSKWGRP